jgi:uncharacterized caspase-like protein
MGMKRLVLLVVLCLTGLFAKAETYVVVVGIANYKYISSLTLPEKDAKSIADLYKRKTKNVILITGRYATKKNILKALSSQFGRAKADDEIVFSYSGHGYVGGICPYDMSGKSDGLSYKEILSRFKQSKAGRKIIFADACMSGGFRVESHEAPSSAMSSSNVLTFLSSRNNEYSQESAFMSNGVFTTYLLGGLRGKADVDRNRKITAKELFSYVSKSVSDKTNGKQHPVMWGRFRDDMVVMEW